MRQSIGTTFMLNFIILFIFLVFAFLAGTLSYYKAYRVNNAIVHAIEKYEGYNEYSKIEINDKLSNLAYETQILKNDISGYCPATWKVAEMYVSDYNKSGYLTIDGDGQGRYGYCIYEYHQDNNFGAYGGGVETTDNYYTYGVLTYLQFQFPGVQYLLKIPIFSRTNRMYYYG